MQPRDLLIAAEWGWPDYLEYLHARMPLSVINNFYSVEEWIRNIRQAGGTVYITDPNSYSDEHFAWLESQSGVRREYLTRLADVPAFSCYGKTIFVARITN
jgi:hypothetical protein